MNIKNIYRKGAGSMVCGIAAAMMALPVLTSCEDFFTQESDDVLYADQEHLNIAEDSIYSVTGILTKLQSLADRTVLLGELRGDLVDLTTVANNDLREIYEFNVSDDNMYNQPSDYYAVINNCNYFIEHVDTALHDNRGEVIFMKEYCAVKAIRAWTYLQLAINYGEVPFFDKALLSKEQAENAERSPKYGIVDVCDYFINDLNSLPERYNREYPGYRQIRGLESKLLYFPLSIVRGDLYLWRATMTGNVEDYKNAARHYYKYISERNGAFSAYPTTVSRIYWTPGQSSWNSWTTYSDVTNPSESVSDNAELITLIAGDSIRAEGHYSELRNIFTSREENDYKVSVTPSDRMIEISESQANCVLAANGLSVSYSPKGLDDHRSGDLRLSSVWDESYTIDRVTNKRIETQRISKYSSSRNVHIYRRTMVYMRLAEALNGAGYPRMAFQILAQGLSNEAIEENVMSRYYNYDAENDTLVMSQKDSLFLAEFNFDNNLYGVCDNLDLAKTTAAGHNQIGIHMRGSGYTPMDTTYVLPHDTIETDPVKRAQLIKEQQAAVDTLLLTESALEFAFEGTRYYDIMRFAKRQANPAAAMKQIIEARRGTKGTTSVPLTDESSWFLKWNGKLGVFKN